MPEESAPEPTPEQRARAVLVLKLSGLSDVALGLALPFLGPDLFDLETFTCVLLGGALASLGIVVWGIGHWGYGGKPRNRRTGSVVRRSR